MLAMSAQMKVGDQVRLKFVPDWLVHDLPASEKLEIYAFIGHTATISEIDSYGYFWIGFGEMHETAESVEYSGHSFCVPPECLEPV